MADNKRIPHAALVAYLETDSEEIDQLIADKVLPKPTSAGFVFIDVVKAYAIHHRQQSQQTETETVDSAELAKRLSLTTRQITNLRAQGVIQSDTAKRSKSQYDLRATTIAYIEHLRDRKGWLTEKEKGQRLENELKEEQLAKARGEVYDRATIDRDFTSYAAEIVKLHKSFTTHLKKRNPKVAQRVWDAIDERLATIRQAAKEIRISNEAITGDSED